MDFLLMTLCVCNSLLSTLFSYLSSLVSSLFFSSPLPISPLLFFPLLPPLPALPDSSAQKLMNLPMSKGPLMVVLTCTISDSIKKPDKLDMFVQAVEQIHSESNSQLQDFSDPPVYMHP